FPAGALSPMTEIISKPTRKSKHANNNPASMKETIMNPLTEFKKLSILPLRITQAFVVVTMLLMVPALLGQATQHREGPPDVTVSGSFGRMFRNLPPFAPPTNAVRDALMQLGSLGGLLDANDDRAAVSVVLIVDPSLGFIMRNSPA